MVSALRRRRSFDIWPGFVDALATLLILIIFLLMIFVVAQFYLSEVLSGRDKTLDRLNAQIAELADMLALEREAGADMRESVAQLSAQLQASIKTRDHLNERLLNTASERDSLAAALAALQEETAGAKEALEEKDRQVDSLTAALAALREKTAGAEEAISEREIEISTLRERLSSTESSLTAAESDLDDTRRRLTSQEAISEEAMARVEILNLQLAALRQQIARLSVALEASEAKTEDQKAQIANLGQRLNAALASKVQELARYRSEFFGRLREILGQRDDIQIVGDRFVFQSDVLFASGAAELDEAGRRQIAYLANVLIAIAAEIPPEINWILRVDGHTDIVPIATRQFGSNWELSTARAVSVVKYLIELGVPPERLAATGFGEFQPLTTGISQEDLRRNRRIELRFDQR
jgi:chemotaxis protein MotB